MYGFYDECIQKYGNSNIWKNFTDIFMCLPLAALIANKVFCLHGGLSPSINSLDDLTKLKRFCDIPHDGGMCDLMWSDPGEAKKGFVPSPRSAGYVFGIDVTDKFLRKNDLLFIARAH